MQNNALIRSEGTITLIQQVVLLFQKSSEKTNLYHIRFNLMFSNESLMICLSRWEKRIKCRKKVLLAKLIGRFPGKRIYIFWPNHLNEFRS